MSPRAVGALVLSLIVFAFLVTAAALLGVREFLKGVGIMAAIVAAASVMSGSTIALSTNKWPWSKS